MIHQQKKPKPSIGRKWNDLVSKIWKEIKPTKYGGLVKYHEDPIEYKYIDNINQMQHRLERHVDKPKRLEYIIRVFNSLPKGIVKSGSGVFNTIFNKLNNVMPELHLPGYNYCGPFTKLDKRLARGDEPINKLDAGCKNHNIFYRDHKDTKERHLAYKELANIADERMYASDSSIHERVDAALSKSCYER